MALILDAKNCSLDLNNVSYKLVQNILQFFDNDTIKTLHFINHKLNTYKKISLRKINFFVIIFSKLENTYVYKNGKPFYIYLEYTLQLRLYRRRFFDPFRRGNLKVFYNYDGKQYWSTLPQLNFFKWIFENQILDYIVENEYKIFTKINSITNEHKEKKKGQKNNGNKKRIMLANDDNLNVVKNTKTLFKYSS
tara:strand:+ start:50 stop:628 length:579 start_codon:yes stop_codon:yes gene_type:complete